MSRMSSTISTFFALDGLVEILDELDRAGSALALSVAGDGDKVKGGVGLDSPRQIGQKERRAFEHTNHHQLFTVQVVGNLGAHLGHAFGDLLTGIKNLKPLIGDGSHADSIAGIRDLRARTSVKIAGRDRVANDVRDRATSILERG